MMLRLMVDDVTHWARDYKARPRARARATPRAPRLGPRRPGVACSYVIYIRI